MRATVRIYSGLALANHKISSLLNIPESTIVDIIQRAKQRTTQDVHPHEVVQESVAYVAAQIMVIRPTMLPMFNINCYN